MCKKYKSVLLQWFLYLRTGSLKKGHPKTWTWWMNDGQHRIPISFFWLQWLGIATMEPVRLMAHPSDVPASNHLPDVVAKCHTLASQNRTNHRCSPKRSKSSHLDSLAEPPSIVGFSIHVLFQSNNKSNYVITYNAFPHSTSTFGPLWLWATNAVRSNLISRRSAGITSITTTGVLSLSERNLRQKSIQQAVSFYHNNDKKCWTSILFGITCRKQINRAPASKEETFPCKNQHRASLVPADMKRMLVTGNF